MPLYPPVFALPLAALAQVAISREHICLGVGKTVVDPLLVKGWVLQDFWVFQRMRVKGSRFQHDGAYWQDRLHKADFPQVSVYFASHRWRETPLFDGFAAVQPARLAISGLAGLSISAVLSALFHCGCNIVSPLDFRKVEDVFTLIR